MEYPTAKMTDYIKKAISNGEQIEEIIISAKNTAEVKFKRHSITYSNMTPSNLGKYVHNYLRLKYKQINIIHKGLTETEIKDYKKEVVESICDLVGLPNNYNNKNTPIKININPTIIETQA